MTALFPRSRRAHRVSGMTLIEILVVLIVMVLLASAVAVGLGGLRGAKLEDEALRLSRMSRSALMHALTRATTVRLVIDLDARTVAAESASGRALVDETGRMIESDAGDAEEDRDGGGPIAEPEERDPAQNEGVDDLPGAWFGAGSLFGGSSVFEELSEPPAYTPPQFAPVDDSRLATIRFERAAAVRVYLAGQDEPIEEGRVYLLYYDDGTTDGAVIHLEDDEGRIWSVAIDPLTGHGALHPYPYLPEPVEVLP